MLLSWSFTLFTLGNFTLLLPKTTEDVSWKYSSYNSIRNEKFWQCWKNPAASDCLVERLFHCSSTPNGAVRYLSHSNSKSKNLGLGLAWSHLWGTRCNRWSSQAVVSPLLQSRLASQIVSNVDQLHCRAKRHLWMGKRPSSSSQIRRNQWWPA